MPKGDSLTMKQRKFVARVIQTGNPAQSAMDVYDAKNRNVASNIASENLRKPNVREALEKGMIASGISPTLIFDTLKSNMIAGSSGKATVADSNNAARILLKAYEMIDKDNKGGTVGLTVTVDGLSKSELLDAKQKLTRKWDDILGQ